MTKSLAEPLIHAVDQHRFVVLGISGAGKSSFSRALATKLDLPHVELDALFWGPGWQPKPDATFHALTEAAVSAPRWVVDGNYSSVRDIVWPRATVAVWLNFPLWLVLWRVFWRTMRRLLRREALWHGNRESLRRTFLSRESLRLWVITTHRHRQREFSVLRNSQNFPNLQWVELRWPSQANDFVLAVDEQRSHFPREPHSSTAGGNDSTACG
jgi:adenylate kinase family enzyme